MMVMIKKKTSTSKAAVTILSDLMDHQLATTALETLRGAQAGVGCWGLWYNNKTSELILLARWDP